jgi:DUF971 family protein
MNAETPPDEIVVAAGRSALRLVWPDGTLTVTAPRLRAACRCADCRRSRLECDLDPEAGTVTFADVRLVGDHALNLAFSDGHDRGIYPWSFLRTLAT